MRFEPMTPETLPGAKSLVNSIFPRQGPGERLFFWAWERRDRRTVGLLVRLAGVADLGDFWVALDKDETVVGTIGLYRTRKDAHEAVWLSWFTVAPDERGQGLGGRLLDFAIEQARASGVSYLRLYTGTDPIMAKAQQVYESRGLHVYKTTNLLIARVIYRQLELTGPASPA